MARPALLLCWQVLLLLGVAVSPSAQQQCQAQPAAATPAPQPSSEQAERLARVKAVWQQQRRYVRPSELEGLRHQAWSMFDHGYSNYLRHAFPKDNLMPLSCQGQDWQGGLALTLVDSLDTLALLNRRADLQEAVELLRHTLSFDKDAKVHVFETTIRVLGGLLSGHVLLAADPGLVPGYDGVLLASAQDLGSRLLAAFDTPSGLPGGHVHLQKGMVAGENVSCTACAGTLLLEFGLLSQLTGNDSYVRAAQHAATVLYERRSPLGLVGSSFHVEANTWSHLSSTIGPGSDSYYEYLLKAYLMFGDRKYLDMFIELYVATMRHMKLPGPALTRNRRGSFGSAFLMDVHMDSGRLIKPWVSSLGAFWPAMQVLAGQSDDAAALHANFTSAWATWGWLPEAFGVDLHSVHPEDPGYNLRPEHIESTWYLAALTGDPTGQYRGLAANMLRVLNHSWVGCGYAPISDVSTGMHTDLMESYFLSETVKYLYLSFVDSGSLLDYYVLSTEGHIMPSSSNPVDVHVEEDEHYELLMTNFRERLRARREQQLTEQQQQQQKQQQKSCLDNSSNSSNGSSCAAASNAAATSSSSNASSSSSSNSSSDSIVDASSIDGSSSSGRSSSSHAGSVADSSSAAGSSDSPSDAELAPRLSLLGDDLSRLPDNCRALCAGRGPEDEAAAQHALQQALPLLPLELRASRRIRYRRCVACIKTTQALADVPQDPLAARLARFNFGQSSSSSGSSSSNSQQQRSSQRVAAFPPGPATTDIEALPSSAGVAVLAQALCLMAVSQGRLVCEALRAVSALDTTSMLPENAAVMQLSGLKAEAFPAAAAPAFLAALRTEEGGLSTLHAAAALARFGPELPFVGDACVHTLLSQPPDLDQLPLCPIQPPVYPYWRPQQRPLNNSSSSGASSSDAGRLQDDDVWMELWLMHLQQQQLAADPWLMKTPSSSTCAAVRAHHLRSQQQQQQQQEQQQQEGGSSGASPDGGLSSSSSSSSFSSSRALLGSCLGYNPTAFVPGTWLPQPDLFNSSHPCSTPALTAAASNSAAAAASPSSAVLPLVGPLVLADPPNGCGPLRNAALLEDSLVVVWRGGCSFVDKALAVQATGAIGLVVLDHEAQGQLLTMTDDGSGREPGMPVVMLEARDSKLLMYWLQRRPMLGALLGHSNPPLPGRAQVVSLQQQQQQQQQGKHQQQAGKQQQRKQPPKQKQQGAGAGVHKGVPAGQLVDEIVHTRIDLFVPGRTQLWLQQHVTKLGIDAQAAYQMLARDPRVLQVLQLAYARNRAHNGGLHTLVTGQRAAAMSGPSQGATVGSSQQQGAHSGG